MTEDPSDGSPRIPAARPRVRLWAWAPGALAVGLSLTIVAAAAIALSVKVSLFRESRAAVEYTDSVQAQIATIDRQFGDAGIAERGYMILGEPRFLEAYKKVWTVLPGSLNTLRGMLRDNDNLRPTLSHLGQLISERVGLMDDIIALGPAKLRDSLPVLRGSRVVQVTEMVLKDLEQLRRMARERRLREDQVTSRLASDTAVLAGTTSFIAILSAVCMALLLSRQNNRHRAREARAARLHAARLRSQGETTAFFAHELTRPLAIAMNYLVTADLPQDDASRRFATSSVWRMATAQVEQAADIAHHLRDHGGADGRTRAPESMDRLIHETLALMEIDPAVCAVVVAGEAKLPPVLIDKARIQQVLIHLIDNALRAVERSGRRDMRISAAAVENRMVRVEIADSGPGVAETAIEAMFEPFLASGPARRGYGLAISLNILRGHGGKIWLERNQPQGAVFCFTVPIAREDDAGGEARATAVP